MDRSSSDKGLLSTVPVEAAAGDKVLHGLEARVSIIRQTGSRGREVMGEG